MLENNEFNLYKIINEIELHDKKNNLFPCLISLNDNEQIKNIFEQHKPEIIFHAKECLQACAYIRNKYYIRSKK